MDKAPKRVYSSTPYKGTLQPAYPAEEGRQLVTLGPLAYQPPIGIGALAYVPSIAPGYNPLKAP